MARPRMLSRIARFTRVHKAADAVAGSLYRVETQRPVFHLTFDDGPHPVVTPRVLDALDEHDATATFFVLTEMAQLYPGVLQETVSRGHEVGLHTRTHPRLTEATWSSLVDEIRRARSDLEQITGRPVTTFRPPYGAQNLRSLAMVRGSGMRTILWSTDSHDWKGLADDGDVTRHATNQLRPGGILLLHDRPAGDSTEADTASGFVTKEDLTRRYLDEIATQGMTPVSLEALVGSGTPKRRLKL